jgi:hypothetical protein
MMRGAWDIFAPIRILDLGYPTLANPTAIVGSDPTPSVKADPIELARKIPSDLESWE